MKKNHLGHKNTGHFFDEKHKRFFKVKEAAGILGVSTNTIYKYLDEGSLKGKRFNDRGRFKIPFAEIAPYLDQAQAHVAASSAEATKAYSQLPLFEVFSGFIVGIGLVYIVWNFGLAFLNIASYPHLLVDTATAILGYSSRNSSELGNLSVKLAQSTTQIVTLATSKYLPQSNAPQLSQQVETTVSEETRAEPDAVAEAEPTSYEEVLSIIEEAEEKRKVVINATPTGWLRVRSNPNGGEVGRVYPGETYEIFDEWEGWFYIKLEDGQTGWISSEYATLEVEEQSINEPIPSLSPYPE